jgi:hypothetical protein
MFRFSSRDIFEGCITEQQPGKPTAFVEGIHTDYKKDVQHAPSGDRQNGRQVERLQRESKEHPA